MRARLWAEALNLLKGVVETRNAGSCICRLLAQPIWSIIVEFLANTRCAETSSSGR